MALADYRLCDRCERKAFYDANLNYDDKRRDAQGNLVPDYVGDWAVLCEDCAKTHTTIIVARNPKPEGGK